MNAIAFATLEVQGVSEPEPGIRVDMVESTSMNNKTDDFTEKEYRQLVRLALDKWKPIFFDDYKRKGRVCLWRHDIDVSVHRAYQLAKIEAEEGMYSTFYILPHSSFYNLLEREIAGLLREISVMGHRFGLHFDIHYYLRDGIRRTELETKAGLEKQLLESLLDKKIGTISYHDSSEAPSELVAKEEVVVGMVNARSDCIRSTFGYCSDSNGYWRFRPLRDVLEAGNDERLQVLTHPVWWVPEPMAPRMRIARCIDGRAAWQHRRYDTRLDEMGRENIR